MTLKAPVHFTVWLRLLSLSATWALLEGSSGHSHADPQEERHK